MLRKLAYWLIPDVGGWWAYAACLAVIVLLGNVVDAPEPWAVLLTLLAWLTAMAWYAHWRGRR